MKFMITRFIICTIPGTGIEMSELIVKKEMSLKKNHMNWMERDLNI